MYTDFDFFQVRLHVESSFARLCFARIRVYEELSLADNLINERSIYSPRQEIRDCRNHLYQPVGETRFMNPAEYLREEET